MDTHDRTNTLNRAIRNARFTYWNTLADALRTYEHTLTVAIAEYATSSHGDARNDADGGNTPAEPERGS